ncbi:MAG TPA: hypothetical protein IAD47_07045 [Candidatus Limihabitans stercoravium]|nr:hypothetical protein [Candidatus Limihabitans stercoravium]
MKKTQILSLVVILVLALTVVLAACQPAAPAGDALEEVKTAGKTEIDNYAKNFAQSDYTADGWTALQKAVTDGKAAVDAATNAEGVFTAVNNAKSAMDKVAKAPAATSEYVAYGLVHGNGYVGKATVTVDANGVVTDATLDEACLPTYVTAEEPVEGVTTTDKVTSHGSEVTKHFYTTVKFGGYTATYDLATHTYLINGLPMLDRFQSTVYARAWFEAVYTDSVVVVVSADGKTEDGEIMNSATLLKSQNGYWNKPTEPALGWEENAVATSTFFVENYEAFVPAFYQNGPENLFYGHSSNGQPWFWNGINTGATWTDMEDYITLLVVAYAQPSQSFAYGLVHGKGYVGQAGIIRTLQGKVIAADLEEACLPTYIAAEAAIEDVTTTDEAYPSHGSEVTKHFYTTVKFGGNTFTYSTTEHDYVMEGTTLKAWLEDEANAMVYFLSVYNNQVAIVNAEGEDDFTVMTSAKLFKSQNGYWSTPSGSQLGWKTNVEKTVEYVINNGFAQEEFTADNKLSSGVIVDDNGISTGATWTDFNDYYQLLKKAYETQVSIGSFNYYIQAWSSNYGVQVAVTVEDGIITDIVVLNDAVTGWHQITPSWEDHDSCVELQAEFVESLIGLSVEEIYDMTAAFNLASGTSVSAGGEEGVSAVGGNGVMTGATQSEARLLLAIWNALLGL